MIIKSSYSNTPVWRDIHVHAVLPPELQPLEEIAHNLWWVWNEEVKAILETLDPDEWEESDKNPVVMLQNLRSDVTERSIKNTELVERIQKVYNDYKEYMNVPFNSERPSIAYFSMEYGLSHVLKIRLFYSNPFRGWAADCKIRSTEFWQPSYQSDYER